MTSNSTKTCVSCDAEKSTSEFYRANKIGTANDGIMRWQAKCKVCCRAETKARKLDAREAGVVSFVRARLSAPPQPRTAAELLFRQPLITYAGDWSNQDLADLRVLCAASVPKDRIAGILGRSIGGVYDKARGEGIDLPRLIRPKKPRIIKPPTALPLAFPYIAAPKPSNTDLLRANALVPHAWPEWKRADICQAIMLALFEGEITLAELEANRANLKWFSRQYARSQDPYEEIILGPGAEDDERPYYDRVGGFTEATQEDEIYARELASGRPFATEAQSHSRVDLVSM